MLLLIFQAFFWLFGVVTCAYYTLVLLMHFQPVGVFYPLVIIALSNAYLLIAINKTPSMTADRLVFLSNIHKFAVTVATVHVTVLSPLILLAAIMLGLSITFLFSALTVHQPVDQSFTPFIYCAFYLFVAIGPFTTATSLSLKLRALNPQPRQLATISFASCFAILFAIILFGVFPYALTRTCEAASVVPANMPKSLLLMRAAGNEAALLNDCYSDSEGLPCFLLAGMSWNFVRVPISAARELYYRVYGRPFNTRKHRSGQDNLIIFDFMEIFNLLKDEATDSFGYYWESDSDFAGEQVGGVIHGLDLSSSEIYGSVNSDECVANLDWTMTFHNINHSDKELRAQILLPPHAVISGCALVIDGVRHGAVFATRESSRHAYVESAESGYTPLLMSTVGAGRVLLQTTSGYNGKDVQLSLQITSPLTVVNPSKVALPLPMITEKNFAIKCKHEVKISPSKGAAQAEGTDAIFWNRNADKKSFYTRDPDKKDAAIIENIVSQKFAPDQPLIVVVDGSDKMSGSIDKVSDQLAKLKSKKASIIWASDKPIVVIANADTNSEQWKTAVARLRDSACIGGQDNAAALSLALKTGGLSADSNVIWLHGPQPVAFTGGKLLPLIKSLKHSLKLFEYQMVPGPNEVIKSMDQTPALHQVPDIEGAEKDLAHLFAVVSGQKEEWIIERESVPAAPNDAILSENGKSLLQLYYSDVILTDKKTAASVRKLGSVAEKLGMVTPVTSAIVMDWKNQNRSVNIEQYSQPVKTSQAGSSTSKMLEALPGNMSIPVKPEPPLPVTIACAALMMTGVLWSKRKKNPSAPTS
jgi:hypothetical protein